MNPNRDTKTVPKKCVLCGVNFLISLYNAKRGRGTYCSQRCTRLSWSKPAKERFMDKVKKTNTCWLWTGAKNKLGYGSFGIGSRLDGSRGTTPAHRFSHELFKGPIPKGLVIDHLCRNPSCVNPNHIEAVTNRENALRGASANKTRCVHGHPYTKDNTAFYRNRWGYKSRFCRTCSRIRDRIKYAASKGAHP